MSDPSAGQPVTEPVGPPPGPAPTDSPGVPGAPGAGATIRCPAPLGELHGDRVTGGDRRRTGERAAR